MRHAYALYFRCLLRVIRYRGVDTVFASATDALVLKSAYQTVMLPKKVSLEIDTAILFLRQQRESGHFSLTQNVYKG